MDVNVYINGQKKCNRLHCWGQKNEHLYCSHQLLFFGMIALFLVVVKDFFKFGSRFSHIRQNGCFQRHFIRLSAGYLYFLGFSHPRHCSTFNCFMSQNRNCRSILSHAIHFLAPPQTFIVVGARENCKCNRNSHSSYVQVVPVSPSQMLHSFSSASTFRNWQDTSFRWSKNLLLTPFTSGLLANQIAVSAPCATLRPKRRLTNRRIRRIRGAVSR